MGTINNELLIIKSNLTWKFNSNFKLFPEFPAKISKVFPNLPLRFRKIDAFYQSSEGSEINIFSGGEFVTHDTRGPIYMAYNLTRYTNDPDIEGIDAAMVWGEFKKKIQEKIQKFKTFFTIFSQKQQNLSLLERSLLALFRRSSNGSFLSTNHEALERSAKESHWRHLVS